MRDNQKILILMPALWGGGTEQALLNLLKHIAENNNRYDIDILIMYRGGKYDHRVNETIFNHFNFKYITNNRYILKVLSILSKNKFTSALLSRIIIRDNYDVGICYEESFWSSLIAYSNKIAKKVSWTHVMMTTNPGYRNLLENKRTLRRFLVKHEKFDQRVFVSKASMNSFESLSAITEKNMIVYNMLDFERISKMSKENENNGARLKNISKLKITMIGNLTDVKNVPFAMEVFRALKSKGVSFFATIVGAGTNYIFINNLREEYGLQENVSLEGFHQNPYPYILHSDVYFSTSISEARPTALIEAVYLKRPYIVPDIPSFVELHEDYNAGIIYKLNSVESAVNAFKNFITNEKLKSSFDMNMEKINWNQYGENYVEVFDLNKHNH